MKALLQRVSWARVRVAGRTVGEIGPGVLVFLGVLHGDGEREVERLSEKVARFRMFQDGAGKMNLDVLEAGGAALVVSQFTLCADGRKGRRPSFDAAAPPQRARELYEAFAARLRGLGLVVATGEFGASMKVELENDGPVTFLLEDAPEGDGGAR